MPSVRTVFPKEQYEITVAFLYSTKKQNDFEGLNKNIIPYKSLLTQQITMRQSL